MTAAPLGGSLSVSTVVQLGEDTPLAEAWRLQQRIGQLFACAFDERPTPEEEPIALRQRLAEGAGAPDFEALVAKLRETRTAARAAFDEALPPISDGESSSPR